MAGEKYQVFVSSTYEDLKDERDAVIKAVLQMGHIPVGMEMFSAADEEQWQVIARNIEQSDYYVVIIAHRYGSVTDGQSYTRKEYEYAVAKGVPVLGFIIADDAPWPGDRMDTTEPEASMLLAFKERVRQKPVDFWSSASDLHSKCAVALMKAFTTNPREGWVRASTAAGPLVTAELSRLSAENADLRRRLAEAQSEAAADHEAAIEKTMQILKTRTYRLSWRERVRSSWEDAVEVRATQLFDWLAPRMVVEISVNDAAQWIAMNIRTGDESDIVPLNQVQHVLTEFMALGLAEPSTKRHSVTDTAEYWSLAPHGVDLMKHLRSAALNRQLEAASTMATQPSASTSMGETAKKVTAKKTSAKKTSAKKATAKKATGA